MNWTLRTARLRVEFSHHRRHFGSGQGARIAIEVDSAGIERGDFMGSENRVMATNKEIAEAVNLLGKIKENMPKNLKLANLGNYEVQLNSFDVKKTDKATVLDLIAKLKTSF